MNREAEVGVGLDRASSRTSKRSTSWRNAIFGTVLVTVGLLTALVSVLARRTDNAALAAAAAGEAGRLGAREGGWVYFTVDATRAGWVPASALMPIEPVQPARLTGLAPVR